MFEQIMVLKSVTHFVEENSIQVLWVKRSIYEGAVIAEENFRRAYGSVDRNLFLVDLGDNAAKYDGLMNWA